MESLKNRESVVTEELEKASKLLDEPCLQERIEKEGICIIPEDLPYHDNGFLIKDGKTYKSTPYGEILCKSAEEIEENLEEGQNGVVVLQHDKGNDISEKFFRPKNLSNWLKYNKKSPISYMREPIITIDPI